MSVTISSSVSIATRRLNDLRTYQLPRLIQCQGPVQLFREIADEMKGDLEGVRRSIEVGWLGSAGALFALRAVYPS